MERVITPLLERSAQSGRPGPTGIRPNDGLSTDRPHNEAGIRNEPPPSEPVAIGTMPEATAAAEPPDDPPADLGGDQGLPVRPNSGLSVSPFQASSGVFVLPTTTQPA